ncbi:MAG: hypothetical protein ABUL62_26190 [Myxococcales bacterium]|jgi:hypothetical protein
MMNLGRKYWLGAGALVLIAASGAYFSFRSPEPSPRFARRANLADAPPQPANQVHYANPDREKAATHGDQPDPTPRQLARQLADSVRARLRSEPQQGGAIHPAAMPHPAVEAPASSMPAPAGSGNQSNSPLGRYVQDVVKRQFFPIANSCYEDALHAQPDAGGSITLNVTVVGDEAVGGVVDSVEVDKDSTIVDPEFVTCLRESMYALSFAAPPARRASRHLRVSFCLFP